MTAHRYWRIYQPPGYFGFSETQFRTVPGTPLLFTMGTATAQNTYGGVPGPYDAPHAADNNTNTLYSNGDLAPENWWQWDYGAGGGFDVREVMIQSRNDGYWNNAPNNVAIQYSDDGAVWTTQASFPAVTWNGPGQQQVFAVQPSTAPGGTPRVAQSTLDAAGAALFPAGRAAQATLDTVGSNPAPAGRVAQATADAVGSNPASAARAALVALDAAGSNPAAAVRVALVSFDVIAKTVYLNPPQVFFLG